VDVDWLDLLIGFALGVAGTLLFWIPDRRRARRATEAEWTRAARQIEVLVLDPQTRGGALRTLTQSMPIDHWRSQLGPSDFRLLEKLEGAYWRAQHAAGGHAEKARDFYAARGRTPPRLQPEVHTLALLAHVDPDAFHALPLTSADRAAVDELRSDPAYLATESRVVAATGMLDTARTDFVNMARARDSDEYNDVLRAEHRRTTLRHPIQAIRKGRRR
jgi:hypothetical protein